MSYGQTRDDEQLSKLNDAIGEFISRYNANPSHTDRKTIILFPGGMGSWLLRASTPEPHGPPYAYNTVWLDCSIAFDAALHLGMQADVDHQQQIVVPDGPVDFLTLRPYQGFVQWCDNNEFDYFIFGWDWRRQLIPTVDFFLACFLPLFRQRVIDECEADPLEDFSLVGHSFGGMIVKLILNRTNNPYVQLMKRAVTVATPFYGYGGQVHRYFEGDPVLNFKGKRTITRIISSLAAGYTLMFLDEDTYKRDGPQLNSGPYPLRSYPSKDAANPAEIADPYNPTPSGGRVRYPRNHGFDLVALQSGKLTYQQVAAPLDPAVNAKFFNFRGVQARNGAVINDTVNRQTWRRIRPNFDPETDPCPITDILGPGDGTLPAWSTRLVSTPGGNVIDLVRDIEHMDMMSDPAVLQQLGMVI
jgi:pimeloyl-ACP methyl ester carboxylesterase